MKAGATLAFAVAPSPGFAFGPSPVSGSCPAGSWSGWTYTTGAITANCSIGFAAIAATTLTTTATVTSINTNTQTVTQTNTSSSTATQTQVQVGAAFYVSPNGNDGNAGTLAAPFLTLAKAQSAMRASSVKTTYLREGTYTIDQPISLANSDSGETWAGYPDDPAQSAILLAGGANTTFEIQGSSASSQLANIAITNLTFDGGTSGGGGVGGGAIFITGNTNNIVIRHNHFENNSNQSDLFIYNSDDIYFQENSSGPNEYEPVSGHLTDGVEHTGLYVTDNTLAGFSRMGIELQDNSALTLGFQDVHVDRNKITTWTTGPAWDNDIAVSFVTYNATTKCNSLSNNTFIGTPGTGAWAIELAATNTSVENNVMTNIDYPVFFGPSAGSVYENNKVTDTGSITPFDKDGGFDNSQWVGVNTINGVVTTGWAQEPNVTAKPAVCAPSALPAN